MPAAREYLSIIQTRAVLTEQLEGEHFRFRELKRGELVVEKGKRESVPYPIDAEQIFLRTQNLLGFPTEFAMVLYSGRFDASLVPE